MSENRETRKKMIADWGMTNIDWFGYEKAEDEIFSFHHIVPRHSGGLYTINNGSILNDKSSHPYIHLIEVVDPEMFVYLTNILININNQREMPNRQQLLAIRGVLEQFEREHCSDRSNKGRLLIKPRFVEGRINIK